MPLCVRQVPTRVLIAVNMLQNLALPARLNRARNGRREPYFKMSCQAPVGGRREIYLGALDPNAEQLVRQVIDTRPPTNRELCQRVRQLRAVRQQLRDHAQRLAAAEGWYFRGYRLVRGKAHVDP